jgi:hypothetical protein
MCAPNYYSIILLLLLVPSRTVRRLALNASCASRSYLRPPTHLVLLTHHLQKATCSIERDETYVPRTRTDYGLPPPGKAQPPDYHQAFEDAPIYTLGRILVMQFLGWHLYILNNALGSPSYPPGTNVSLPFSFQRL